MEERGIPLHPIVILACPRSGSSMVSGIFHYHGVWVGNCRRPDRFNEKGYFENQDVKNLLKKYCGVLVQKCEVAEESDEFLTEVEKLKPQFPWLVKHSSMYWKVWRPWEPVYICVRRSIEGSVKSNRKTGMVGQKNIRRIIERHHDEMDRSGGINVYTDQIIEGDDSSLRTAIEFCSLNYDPEITRKFVDPTLWHYKTSQTTTT